MRLGVVILPEHRWSEGRFLWERAEELGFDHAWTYDHLAWRSLRDAPWFAAVPTLTAAALVTSTLRLGTLVASPNFRHPVPFAREVLSLDDVSGGRFILGIGAGGTGWDAEMLDQTPWTASDRADRFEGFVALLDRLLTSPEVTSDGEFYRAVGARSYPGCLQQPRVPFAIAATGRRGMALAARFATTWVTYGDPSYEGPALGPGPGSAVVAAQIRRLEAACAAAGRDPATLDRLVLTGTVLADGLSSPDLFAETVATYEAVGVTDLVVHWPRPSEPYAGDTLDLERAVRGVRPDGPR